jgi:hypothetical protein
MGFYHLPIQTFIALGNLVDLRPSNLFKLNVSHLESMNFWALIQKGL